MAKPLVALLTDFGTRDHYAAVMKGVVLSINPDAQPISPALHNKHHFRKHGPSATYGQK